MLVGFQKNKVPIYLFFLSFCFIFIIYLSSHSLAATILSARPDLAKKLKNVDKTEPIPTQPPTDYFKEHIDNIADIGEPITATFLKSTHADPTNWYQIFIQLCLSNFSFKGGCSRNTMAFAPFGIP